MMSTSHPLRQISVLLLLLLTIAVGSAFAQTISPSTLPLAYTGQYYSQQLSVNLAGAATWSDSSIIGQTGLPNGITIDSATGVLSGIPTLAGSYTFRIGVSIRLVTGGVANGSIDYTLAVNAPVFFNVEGLPSGRVGVPYSYQVPVSGGVGTLAVSLTSGSLPAGLSIASNGTISGIPLGPPTGATTPTFDLTVQDSESPPSVAVGTYSIFILPAVLSITPPAVLPSGVQGANYSYSFSTNVAGGLPSYFYSLNSGSTLPNGLSLNSSTGVLSGIIAANATPGQYTINIGVFDSASQSASGSTILNVRTPLSITTTSLPDGVTGRAYSGSVAATGGVSPYVFTATPGTLPPGVSLASNGTLSGTPTTAGTYNVAFQVSDADTPAQTANRSIQIRIASPLTFNTSSLPAAVIGVNYSTSISTSGGLGFVSVQSTGSCTGGPGTGLPPGITLTSGSLSGTPTTVGTYTFCVQANDFASPQQLITQLFQLSVTPPISITTTSLPDGITGQPYSGSLAATGGQTPYNFTAPPGSLPPGVSLASNGTLSGTPTTAGTYNITFQVTDASVPAQSTTKPLSIRIAAPLTFTTTSPLPSAVAGVSYSTSINTNGGLGFVNVQTATSCTGGPGTGLPAGLTLTSGGFSGTPTTAGTYTFCLQASDSATPQQTITQLFQLVVNPPLSIITNSPLPVALRGVAYAASITAAGGITPYSFAVTAGALPPGLTLSSAGAITGLATQTGTFTFTVTVTDSYGRVASTASKQFTINVFDPVTISPATLPNTVVGAIYDSSLSATGGTAPYQFSIASGSLPPGLSLSSAGRITGIVQPGATTSTTTYTFVVRATDSTTSPAALQGTQTYSITVAPQTLTFTVGVQLPNATAGRPYGATITTAGGTPPIIFSLSGGALPAGLSLDPATGIISGTPSTQGSYSFVVGARDSAVPTNRVQSISQVFNLTVLAPRQDLQISANTTLPDGTIDLPYSAGISASGGQPPYSFRLNTGSLPDGLVLNSDGSITGTPKKVGTFTFGVLVGDASQVAFSGAFFTIKINPAPLTITGNLPGGAVGQPYGGTIGATGGVAPYRFSVSGLPAGVTFNSSTNSISGTPTTADTYNVTVSVTDSLGATASRNFTVVITSTLRLTTNSIPDGVVGQPYSASFAASGGTPPYAFAVSGMVPDGLSIDSVKGIISGTPTASGAINVAVQVTDQSGQKDSRTFSASVVSTLTITTNGPLAAGTVNERYSGSVAASGGTLPYTFSGGGAGLTVNADGSITGTPTQAGNFAVNATVTDKNGLTASKSLAITIRDAVTPVTLSGTVGNGTVGTAFGGSFTASGGTQPYTFSIVSGSLPTGVQISGNSLSGTPTAPGTFTFTVQVTDNANQTATANFTTVIALPPAPTVVINAPTVAVQPQQQPVVGVTISAPFPVPITGTMTLTFTPDVVNGAGSGDPAVQFATGGQSVNFTIPAGQTTATFPVSNLQIQTGTTAGTITLRVTLTAAGTTLTPPSVPDRTIQIARTAPVISSVKVTRTSSGFSIDITGFSTPREVISGNFTFTAAAGSTIQTSTLTVPLTSVLSAYYQSSASQPFGSQFTITVPFNVTQGVATSITGVSVTLTNSVGTSSAVSATF